MTASPSPASIAALLATMVLLAACVPAAGPAPSSAAAPRSSACEDPLYQQLRGSDPDALTEREWLRLQHLEELCVLERRAADARPGDPDRPTVAGDSHGAMWLWMPAMMVVGGLMWLMMGT